MSQSTVALCFDFDAVSTWLHTFKAHHSPTKHSRGVFGAEVGSRRILDVLDEADVPSTWFVPGHTADSFPDAVEAVLSDGHAIQSHGWSHTNPSEYESKADERADLKRSLASLESLTGETPSGYRSPYWDFSRHTLELLQDLGFEWSSSLMGREFEPYYLRENWSADPDEPYDPGERTDVLEFPVSWYRDDWPALQFVMGASSQGPRPNEQAFFEAWRAQFDWMHEHVDGGIFTLTMHPQITGVAPRPEYLAELIDHMASKPDVTFRTLDSVAADIRS
ncbi:polysaccharide deacetylase [Natrialba swarupiae]|uniref:Polysaccharide deacetylase n=2 Tax=Natrialba swarupiae TaxID=2448032 RepID=A0A5D5ANS6_9EURY|nr:polysaccharide deacetylase [Natrialba swarupiae]